MAGSWDLMLAKDRRKVRANRRAVEVDRIGVRPDLEAMKGRKEKKEEEEDI